MKRLITSATVLALHAAATAQPQTGALRFQVSYDGFLWSSEIGVDNGFEFKIRAIAEWTDGPTSSVGFSNATLEQIDLIGARMFDDTFDIAGAFRRTPFDETWTLQAGTGASVGWAKIDDISPVSTINMGQLPLILPGGIPNPNFDASNPLVVFQMDCRYGFGHGDNITVTGEWSRTGVPAMNDFSTYVTPTGVRARPAQEAVVIPALVRYVGPTPGTAGLFFFAATLAGRRR